MDIAKIFDTWSSAMCDENTLFDPSQVRPERLQNIQHERVAKSVNLRRERLLKRWREGLFVKTRWVVAVKGQVGSRRFVSQNVAFGDPRLDLFSGKSCVFLARLLGSLAATCGLTASTLDGQIEPNVSRRVLYISLSRRWP